MKPSFDLTGKVVVITGAAGILCSCISRALSECGCKLALMDLAEDRVNALAEELNKAGGDAMPIAASVLEKDALEKALESVLQRFGTVDVLINGAGGNHPSATTTDDDPESLFDVPMDAMRKVFDLNMMGTLLPSQIFGRILMEKNEGCILNIGSMSGFRPLTRVPLYGAAKAAVHNLTEFLAGYFPKHGATNVRVNAIAPGFFLTEQNRFLLTDKETGGDTPRGQHIKTQTPMGRFGDPEELLGAVVYLISPSASFVNGVVLPIDGGFNAFSI